VSGDGVSTQDPSSFSGRARRDPDVVAAASLNLEHDPVLPGQLVAGSPTTGSAQLGEFGGHEYGVWEHTVGTSTDVETDELFIVLSGAATVEFIDEERLVRLCPGSLMRLEAGQRTVWTVTETLRKVYFS
jgi:uncharacterized cupin superfamily protein